MKEIGNKVFSIGISLSGVRDRFHFYSVDVEYIALIADRPKALIVKEGRMSIAAGWGSMWRSEASKAPRPGPLSLLLSRLIWPLFTPTKKEKSVSQSLSGRRGGHRPNAGGSPNGNL